MADIQAILVAALMTLAAVSVSRTIAELSTTTGDTVNIPCLFGEGTLRNIFWYYNNGTGRHKILSIVKGVLTIAAEYVDRASLQDNNSTLIFKDITVADEGTYCCDVDRLKQTAVTNIETKLNVFSLRPDTLPVISPNCTWTVDASSCSINANQSFNLTCTLPNVYPVEDTELIWYQDGQRVSSTDDVTQNDDGTTDISRHIQVSETGNFTCNVTYLSVNGKENTTISVEASIKPPEDVPNTSGKNLIIGLVIAGITIIVLLVIGIFLFIRRQNSRENGDAPTSRNRNDHPQQQGQGLLDRSPGISPNQNGRQQETVTDPGAGPSAASSTIRSIRREVTNEQINKLSKLLPGGKYSELCGILEFDFNYINKIKQSNFNDVTAAFEVLLQEWKLKGRSIEDLDAALQKAGLGGLVPEYKN